MPGLLSRGGATASITGTPGVGSTLFAVLDIGCTASAYQWTRDGVDIVGATGATYLQVAADAGKAVRVRLGGITYTTGGVLVPAASSSGGNWVLPGWVLNGWVL